MGIAEVANDIIGKGFDLAGDIAKQASGFASTAGLKAQILDKNLEYDRLMKTLGAAVYETVKDDPQIVAANEALFTKIAGVVVARQELEDKLAEAEAAAAAARPIDVEPVEPEAPAGADVREPGAAGEAASAGDAVREAAREAAEKLQDAAGDGTADDGAAQPAGYRSATAGGTQEAGE